MENFSYVFQASGGSSSITREQMRSFKKVWAEFSNPKTGHLELPQFTRFFSVRPPEQPQLSSLLMILSPETQWRVRSPDLSSGIQHFKYRRGLQRSGQGDLVTTSRGWPEYKQVGTNSGWYQLCRNSKTQSYLYSPLSRSEDIPRARAWNIIYAYVNPSCTPQVDRGC